MKPDTYEALEKALQKLEKAIVKAHITTVRSDKVLRTRLERLHTESETGGSADDYIDVLAGRSAVQLLLRTVYVRVLEDLGLLELPRFRGLWGYQAFREMAPALGIRSYFKWVFRDISADFPALFVPADDELPLPSEDICKQIWDLWHLDDGKGNLVYDWADRDFDSRFLGDLYQDLDADVRDRYALLQTPDFVEEFILDQTLKPALDEFDPVALEKKGETFRLLDPTCGSGHFLIGALHRMAAYWKDHGCTIWDAYERALASVWGCDINPYAVDVARFRLLLEVLQRTGERDLDKLSGLTFHLRALDSLIPWEGKSGQGAQSELFTGSDRLSKYATAREREENAAFLKRSFHVVVGNPPYVTPKDPQKRDDYRVFWPESACGGYGLTAPFLERIFTLGAMGAFTGQITGNAFTKREFGVSLVERVIPRWDLTDIIDTSGAYIPGHGTPTVVIIGRSRQPVDPKLRCVGGKRGEPKAPRNAAEGMVWAAITGAGRLSDDSNQFVTVSNYPRSYFHEHPWNLNGGGAPELQRTIAAHARQAASDVVELIGYGAVTRLDDAYLVDRGARRRWRIADECVQVYVGGEAVRDWALDPSSDIVFPYTTSNTVPPVMLGNYYPIVWRFRRELWLRQGKGFKTKKDAGGEFYEYSMFYPNRHFSPWKIGIAFVSTHNHFVLDRGGKVFNRSAPIIKLPATATLTDHLDLLGLLNSSTLGFWMKQVFFDKGLTGGGAFRGVAWEVFFEYDSTKLQKAPITTNDRTARITLATALDQTAQDRAACLPAAVLAANTWTANDLHDKLEAARDQYRTLTNRMVALQEELDWLTYGSYGLLVGHQTIGPEDIENIAPGHRPFEILLARHNASCDPDERSEWFRRHGHDETTSIPAFYAQATRDRMTERLQIIASNADVRLIEQPQFKRRWQTPDMAEETKTATKDWLLDRLEDLFTGTLVTPRPYRLEDIVNAWSSGETGARVMAVAKVYAGSSDIDLAMLTESLLRDNAIPDNPYRVYQAEGIRKLRKWQEVWALQDREDQGEKNLKIPEPPEFGKEDFKSPRFFQIRGKLNVPRERFVLFGDVSPAAYGWNGWRDRDRAMAQVEAFTLAESHPTDPLPRPTTDDPRRCGATIGLWESLPDLRRWGPAETREGEYGELLAFAREACGQQKCPCDVVDAWTIAHDDGKKRLPRARKESAPKKKAQTTESIESAAPVKPIKAPKMDEAERYAVSQGLVLYPDGATFDELLPRIGSKDKLEAILDDLKATGDIDTKGRGKKKLYVLTKRA